MDPEHLNLMSQVWTLKMCNFPSGHFPSMPLPQQWAPLYVLAATFGPQVHPLGSHCGLWRLRMPNLTFGKFPLEKLHIWEVANWEIVIWEGALGKMSL